MKLSTKLFFILCIGLSFVSYSQQSFPESWIGNYKGGLSIYGVDSVRMKIKMNLDIVKTANDSIYDWTITYDFKGKKDVRAYSLIIVDRQKGQYKIDEKNSIVIDAYLYNDKIFTSFFKVMESYVIATYTKEENDIVFEIISGKSEPVSTTGNTKQGEEDIPEVVAYLVNGRQKAVLKKAD